VCVVVALLLASRRSRALLLEEALAVPVEVEVGVEVSTAPDAVVRVDLGSGAELIAPARHRTEPPGS
jgi:hypothetical protein